MWHDRDKTPQKASAPTSQFSLWDLESVELGYQFLFDLDFNSAEEKFQEALHGGLMSQKEYNLVAEACEFWHAEFTAVEDSKNPTSNEVHKIFTAYKGYNFHTTINKLQQRILDFVAEMLLTVSPKDERTTLEIFDLLVAKKKFKIATKIMQQAYEEQPGNILIAHALAQAYWHTGQINSSNQIYLDFLLYQPQNILIERIEHPALRNLITQYGKPMSVAYGAIYGLFQIDTLPPEIVYHDEEHKTAIKCLHHIIESEHALQSGDFDRSLAHRKQLHQLSPEITNAYKNFLMKHR